MSKAGKRLIVRLSIVTVIVGLGVFALVQAQIRDTRADQDDAENRIETPPATSTSSTNEFTPPVQQPLRITPVNYNQNEQTNSQPGQNPPGPAAPGSRGGSFGNVDHPASNAKLLPVNPPAETKPRPGLRSIAQFDPNSTPLPNQKYLPAAVSIPHTKNGKSGAGVSVRIGDNQEKANNSVEATNELGKRDQFEGTRSIQYKGAPQFDGPNRSYVVEVNANSNAAALKDFNPNDLRREPAPAQIYDLASDATPGAQHLEGVRTPSLVLEKRAPEEIQVGKPAIFEIHVRNSGPVDANNVMVLDQVPRGTRFVDASPPAQQSPDGQLLWQLGTLKPGDEKSISIQLIPTEEGEIGSVARITFETEASVKTRCTRPQLAIEVQSSQRVLIGETMNYTVKISNPGTGDATGVILEEDVPEGFSHPAGNELEFELGTLRPGESREVKLTLKAEQAGLWENVMLVRADGNLVEQAAARTEVIAPQLSLTTRGPSKRYLERPAIYNIEVANPGTASAKDIEVVAYLHKGMKFVETNNQGQYDPQKHAVYWSLERLPPREHGDIQLTVLPIETGHQRLRVEGRGNLGVEDSVDHSLQVEGLAAVFFDVADVSDPIEVGSDTVYHVRVLNQGSKTATNIKIRAAIPSGMQPIGGDGPTRHRIQGQIIEFDPLSRLAPKGEAVFKIQVRGIQEGDQRIRVQLTSDDFQTPITKEESTRVYADQ